MFSHSVLVNFEVDCLAKSLREGNKGGEIQKDLKTLTFSIFQGTFSICFDIILCCWKPSEALGFLLMGKLKQISELQKLSWHQNALPPSSPSLCLTQAGAWTRPVAGLEPQLTSAGRHFSSFYSWALQLMCGRSVPKMPISIPRRGLKRGGCRECLSVWSRVCVGKSLPLGPRRQDTCSRTQQLRKLIAPVI